MPGAIQDYLGEIVELICWFLSARENPRVFFIYRYDTVDANDKAIFEDWLRYPTDNQLSIAVSSTANRFLGLLKPSTQYLA